MAGKTAWVEIYREKRDSVNRKNGLSSDALTPNGRAGTQLTNICIPSGSIAPGEHCP